MPFPELPEGQTHYFGDGCVPEHTLHDTPFGGIPNSGKAAATSAFEVVAPGSPTAELALEKIKDAVRFSNFAQFFKMEVWQRIESHRISETALDEIAELVWEKFGKMSFEPRETWEKEFDSLMLPLELSTGNVWHDYVRRYNAKIKEFIRSLFP